MAKTQTRAYIGCLAALIGIFGYHNFCVYRGRDLSNQTKLNAESLRGQQLWQKNNCFSCHQLYGLGGYLGPDLTNIYSDRKKGPAYIRSMLNSGIRSMPRFNFGESDKDAIIAFLKAVDKTGRYPNTDARFLLNGWVEIPNSHEK